MFKMFSDVAEPTANHMVRGMFEARKSVFIDLLKWDLPVLAGAYEIDQFDDTHATYLIVCNAEGAHLASARLLPTTRPHILDTLYPQLCEDAPPCGRDSFEITRFCLARSLRAIDRRGARDKIVNGLVTHALAHGISTYSAIAEVGWFQQILSFGWRCRPLGLPQMAGSSMLVALSIDIDADTPAALAAAGVVTPDEPATPLLRSAV